MEVISKRMLRSSLVFALILGVAACGGGGGSSPPKPPVVSLVSDITTATAPATAHLDASGTTDPAGFPITYTWTVSGGGSITGSGSKVTASFPNHGTYTVTVTANNGHATESPSKSQSITVNPAPPTISALSIPINLFGVAPTTIAAQLVATDRENLTLNFAVTAQPNVGTVSINTTTGAINYTAPVGANGGSDSFTVSASNLGATSTATVQIIRNSDPLLENQWHLKNTGQNAFSSIRPTPGNDINIADAWTAGFSGNGIKVGVVDTGLEIQHEDLAANVDPIHSLNFVNGTNNPTPSVAGPDHGTEVAGIIGGAAYNNKGGRGIAYRSSIRGYNLIAPGAFSVANMAASFGGTFESADNDLFNASFGVVSNALPTFSGTYQSITQTTIDLRGGKGAVIVNAAGNDFSQIQGNSSPLCSIANQFGVSCGDPATDERRGGTTPLIVGALNADGTHASYSETGSSLWISAPGGEFGWDTSMVSGGGPTAGMPAIISTNLTGCSNYSTSYNMLDSLGSNTFAPNCQYTAMMNGTSSATPNVAGVVAMMLEANPNLTVRDIKYILAKTAKKVDPNWAGVSSTNVISGANIVLEQGWTTNAAGWSFSNRYGFGGVDASSAVQMARSYTAYLPPKQDNVGNYAFVPAVNAQVNKGTGGSFLTWTVSEAFTKVEQVVIFLNISSTPGLPCNQIELVSPSGTKSIILHAANGFTNSALTNTRILSNAFYGENINGTWELHFYDYCTNTATPTTIPNNAGQFLLLIGH